MENIIVRKATMDDMETLLRFEQGVIAAERPHDATLKPGPLHYYNIGELITAAHIELVVAETNGELIGSGYARIEQAKHYLSHPVHAYLGFMYVDPAHRGKGVNKLVMEALTEWAASKDITELRLDVYYNNTPAITAYERAGFARHMIEMRKGI